jgi:hypothetical protein
VVGAAPADVELLNAIQIAEADARVDAALLNVTQIVALTAE